MNNKKLLAILGSPHQNGATAAMLEFDRLLGTVMEETKKFPKPRLSEKQRYVLLTACNTLYPFSFLCGQSSGAIRSMKEFFKTAGMKYAGKFVLANTKKNFELSKRAKQKISRYFM